MPKEKRLFGYFALPVLIGDEIVAAIDLKADREETKLLIQQWTWVGKAQRQSHKSRIEEELHRFERFQVHTSILYRGGMTETVHMPMPPPLVRPAMTTLCCCVKPGPSESRLPVPSRNRKLSLAMAARPLSTRSSAFMSAGAQVNRQQYFREKGPAPGQN